MICVICRASEIHRGLASIKFERGEVHFVVNHVPARICPGCGETYVDEVVAAELLRIAKELSQAGIPVAECEYLPTGE